MKKNSQDFLLENQIRREELQLLDKLSALDPTTDEYVKVRESLESLEDRRRESEAVKLETAKEKWSLPKKIAGIVVLALASIGVGAAEHYMLSESEDIFEKETRRESKSFFSLGSKLK